jgi:protein involved in polysaccharide export with SLBB domain
MKNIYIKYYAIFVIGYIFILFFSTVFAQISMSDINKLSNQQLDAIKAELQSETKAAVVESISDNTLDGSAPVSITSTAVAIATGDYFGYNYLRKDISFFDNIPTPTDYRLGPGDEILISLWGENNSRENMTINKDGMIYYPNIGFINLSNHTLESAESILIEEFSRIYSTLKNKDNPTNLMLSLGKLKSMNIYFSGHIENPGINLVHPFSDIFSAIVQAGGVNDLGSLREVQLIRNDTIIAIVDFYSFFMDGKNQFSNIKLIDGDVIHVPTIKKRVSISGAVNRPSSYELLNNDTLTDLANYASGFTSTASSNLILDKIIPVDQRSSDDNAKSSMNINFKNAKLITLNNGDSVDVLSISNVNSKVQVLGHVKNPGEFPAINSTLLNILDIAGGFEDPVYRQTIIDPIVVLRKDANQFYSEEIKIRYEDAGQFKLEIDDKIFVYENTNYKHSFAYRIEGEVVQPGTYPINTATITIKEALELAGGLTELGSTNNLVVQQEFTFIDDNGNTVTNSEMVKHATLDFEIGINSVVIAPPVENVVRIEGNVYSPGLTTLIPGSRWPEYIDLAGGYKPETLKGNIYIRRANGNIEKTSRLYIVGKKIYAGDTIVVPVDLNPTAFDPAAFTADILSVLANLVAILAIADNNNN